MKLVKGETPSKLLADRNDPVEDRGRFAGPVDAAARACRGCSFAVATRRAGDESSLQVGEFVPLETQEWSARWEQVAVASLSPQIAATESRAKEFDAATTGRVRAGDS